MKKIIIIVCLLLISFTLPSPIYAGMADDKWTGEDKTLHFGVGGVIGASVNFVY